MADRLISADALKEKWCRECANRGFCNEETGWCDDVKELYAMPTIEPKHGRWIKLYKGNYKCSVCGDWWGCDQSEIVADMKYCPNCGARMDEVK